MRHSALLQSGRPLDETVERLRAEVPPDLVNPPRDFTLMPFWFWNDDLDERELLRQIDDFEKHGVYGFVIHPRLGLPRSIGWMSDSLLHFMRIAIKEAARRDMRVIFYDEGMYPSGSSAGQVVATDPSLACKCLAVLPPGEALPADATIVAEVARHVGERITIIERRSNSVIRGIHYIDEATEAEETPLAGDILNPKTAQVVLKLVYDRFAEEFGEYFGTTILGIFTDEPNALGRTSDRTIRPGNRHVLTEVSRLLGYDFTHHLPSLWFDEPDAERHRAEYAEAIRRLLEETWYRPLSEWCDGHGIALCGHPDQGDEIGVQRYFQYPGQDLVWRWVLPEHPTALEGPESTQGKCSSSAMIHQNRRRNSNEFCGAYGHETTFDEFRWLANWCLVRGVNLLIPHAFYYSVRGPRRDERPPQVGGVGCAWWDQFKPFADHCRRLCWLNTDSVHVCDVAILCNRDRCPWRPAKTCFQSQRDFNYITTEDLQLARIDDSGISLGGMKYRQLLIDPLESDSHGEADRLPAALRPMIDAGRVAWSDGETLRRVTRSVAARQGELYGLDAFGAPDVQVASPAPDLRFRHVRKGGDDYYLFFNEGGRLLETTLQLSVNGPGTWIESSNGHATASHFPLVLRLATHATALLRIEK